MSHEPSYPEDAVGALDVDEPLEEPGRILDSVLQEAEALLKLLRRHAPAALRVNRSRAGLRTGVRA